MKTLDGVLAQKLLLSGYNSICQKEVCLNKMNVFPVPDADTGTNIKITLKNALCGLDSNEEDLGRMIGRFSQNMLMGARGNSGTILAGFYSGLANSLQNKKIASPRDMSEAFSAGYKSAYSSIQRPVEGTILTVIKDATEYLNSHISNISTIENFFEVYLEQLIKSFNNTDELLPELKKAGVKDSGAYGYILIVAGEKSYLEGRTEEPERKNNAASIAETHADAYDRDGSADDLQRKPKGPDFSVFNENSTFDYGYCMEFHLRLMNNKQDVTLFNRNNYILELEKVGSSIVCIQNGTIVKVHVHTYKPSDVITLSQRFGEFLSFKLENMCLQHNEIIGSDKEKDGLYVWEDGGKNLLESILVSEKANTVSAEDLETREDLIIVLSLDKGFSEIFNTFSDVEAVTYNEDDARCTDGKERVFRECITLCEKNLEKNTVIISSDDELFEFVSGKISETEKYKKIKLLHLKSVVEVYFALAMSEGGSLNERIRGFISSANEIKSLCIDNSVDLLFEKLDEELKENDEASLCYLFVPKEFSMELDELEGSLGSRYPDIEFYTNNNLTSDKKIYIGLY